LSFLNPHLNRARSLGGWQECHHSQCGMRKCVGPTSLELLPTHLPALLRRSSNPPSWSRVTCERRRWFEENW
jgi:hypothetical protein